VVIFLIILIFDYFLQNNSGIPVRLLVDDAAHKSFVKLFNDADYWAGVGVTTVLMQDYIVNVFAVSNLIYFFRVVICIIALLYFFPSWGDWWQISCQSSHHW